MIIIVMTIMINRDYDNRDSNDDDCDHRRRLGGWQPEHVPQ